MMFECIIKEDNIVYNIENLIKNDSIFSLLLKFNKNIDMIKWLTQSSTF